MKLQRRTLLLLVLLAAGLVSSGAAAASNAPPESLADCDERVRQDPGSLASFECFYLVARGKQEWEGAVRRLEALLAENPDEPRALFVLALVEVDQGGQRAESLLRRAALLFGAEGEVAGEIQVRVELGLVLEKLGRPDEAEEEMERAASLAEASGDILLEAEADYGKAVLSYRRGDYTKSWIRARQIEGVIFPEGPPRLQQWTLNLLGSILWIEGRFETSLRYFERAVEIAISMGDVFLEVGDRYNEAMAAGKVEEQQGRGVAGAERLLEEALDAAIRARNPMVQSACHIALGDFAEGASAVAHYEQALALARKLDHVRLEVQAMRGRARATAFLDPERAQEAFGEMEEAIELARQSGSRRQTIQGLKMAASLAWELGEKERATEASRAALDALERLRGLQRLEELRARVFSAHAHFYYRLSGWLLRLAVAEGESRPEALQRAVDVMERFRARVLLDSLEAEPGETVEAALQANHAAVLQEIVAVQRRLSDPALGDAARAEALRRLDRLEADESALRERASGEGLPFAVPRVSVDSLRRSLLADEALLAFQISNRSEPGSRWFRGGSWLVVFTARGETVYALPEKRELEDAFAVYQGLIERGDGSERELAELLYERLFQGALEELLPDVERLVVVLDPVMEALPLGSLRRPCENAPLMGRFRLERSPSIAAFLRSRRSEAPLLPTPVLALADPELAASGALEASKERSALFALGASLGPLPHARQEGRALVRRFRRGSLLRSGAEASESFLKGADLSSYAILHFGAHALVDDSNPTRSAVLLAPGGETEDGLLQGRDLAGLDLSDKLVVLAACRSAAGEVIAGEGVMGLAQGFLAGGARAVVASLWPLRDDLAADLFTRFYERLGRGERVSGALRGAQLELAAAGLPTRAWAGVVVLGDGSLAPVAAGAALPSRWALLAVVAVALLVAVTLWRARAGKEP